MVEEVHPGHIIWMTLLFPCCVIIILVNGACIIALFRVKSMNPSTKVWMMSMLIADVCLGVFVCLPHALVGIVSARSERHQKIACFAYFFFSTATLTIGVLSLVFIAIDRYVAVVRPFRYVETFTKSRALVLVALVWIFGLVEPNLRLILFGSDVRIGLHFGIARWCDPSGNLTTMSIKTASYKDWMPVVVNIVFITASFLILLGIYTRLFCISQQHINKIAAMQINNNQNEKRQSQFRSIRTFLFVTVTYFVAWTPFLFIMTYEMCTGVRVSEKVKFLADFLTYLNAWLNCLVYFIRNGEIRKSFREIRKHVFGRCLRIQN